MPIRREGTIGIFRSLPSAPWLSALAESEKDPGRDARRPLIIRRKLHGGEVEPLGVGREAFCTLQFFCRAPDHGSSSMRDLSFVDSALARADNGFNFNDDQLSVMSELNITSANRRSTGRFALKLALAALFLGQQQSHHRVRRVVGGKRGRVDS